MTAFSGASGTGKSTLLNRLLGTDRFEAQAVSRKTGRGRNTTRHAELVPLDAETLVMDTPGYTALSAGGLLPSEAGLLFREFSPYLGQCRFSDCCMNQNRDALCGRPVNPAPWLHPATDRTCIYFMN